MIIEILIYAVIMLTALPVGWLLAWLCKEELVPGRKWFKIILYVLLGVFVLLLIFYRDLPSLLTLGYIEIITVIALIKGKSKKFTAP